MDTIRDYILWMRDFPFTTVPFREADALVLCMLSYFDFSPLFDEGRTQVPLSRAKELLERGEVRVEIVGPDLGYQAILEAAAESLRFGSLLLGGYVDLVRDEPPLQFAAMTFQGHGERFLAFRGTDSSLAGWQEDFMTSFTHTPSQELALECARKALRPGERWRMGGHSKGGNLSLYAACTLPRSQAEQLERVYLLDAPGLCPEVMGDRFMDGLEERFLSIIPRFCVVGKVFEPELPHKRIVRSNAVGLLQHSLATWGIDHGALDQCEENDPRSLWINATVNDWIGDMSQEDRIQFIHDMFDSLSANGARTLEELDDAGAAGFETILRRLRASSDSTKKIIGNLPRQAMNQAINAATQVVGAAAQLAGIKLGIGTEDAASAPKSESE
jgi:hypothetical protein